MCYLHSEMKTTKSKHYFHKINKSTFLIKSYFCQSQCFLLSLGPHSCLAAKFLNIGKIKLFYNENGKEKHIELKLKFSDHFREFKKIQAPLSLI